MSMILVVEDDAILGLDLKMTLEDAGYRVLGPAMSVSEALKLLNDQHVRGAILDLNLGNERSDAIADRLQDDGIPYFFLTGHSAEVLHPRHRSKRVVSKPYHHSDLFRCLTEHFNDPEQ